jgi:DNA-binding MarR family transcriptional regulator
MKTKTHVLIPLAVITSDELSLAAKSIYAVLKSFQTGKTLPHNNSPVIVTHGEIAERSHLSKNTVMKALNQLEKSGWIEQERNIGSANKYIFPQRISQSKD